MSISTPEVGSPWRRRTLPRARPRVHTGTCPVVWRGCPRCRRWPPAPPVPRALRDGVVCVCGLHLTVPPGPAPAAGGPKPVGRRVCGRVGQNRRAAGVGHQHQRVRSGGVAALAQPCPVRPVPHRSPPPLQDGFTALHRSCVTGNIDVIRYLIGRGADVNAEDSVRCGVGVRGWRPPPCPAPRRLPPRPSAVSAFPPVSPATVTCLCTCPRAAVRRLTHALRVLLWAW